MDFSILRRRELPENEEQDGSSEPEAGAASCPRKLYVELTTDCNLACAMCPRHTWEGPGGQMSQETFSAILESSCKLPTSPMVNFSGFGEPTAHPRFLEFLAETRAGRLPVEVVTNGTTLDREHCEAFVELGLRRLIVSVDGLETSSCEMLHEGALRGVADRLRMLNRLRFERGAVGPELWIEFVATKRNIHELPQLKRLAPELGFSCILVSNLIPATPEMAKDILYERWTTASRARRPSHLNPCVDLPQMDVSSQGSEVFEYLQRTRTRVRVNGQEFSGSGPRCRFVEEDRLAIRWDGQVSPCLPLMHTHTYYFRDEARRSVCYHVGNVRETPIRESWDADEYRSFRDRVRSFEFSPCIDCGSCDLREANEEDCFGDAFPRCGECLWAHGIVQCP